MPEHVKKIFDTLGSLPSREEFNESFKKAMQLIADALSAMNKSINTRLAQIKDGKDGRDGARGERGEPGRDGRDGRDGKDGKDGVDGKDANEEGILSNLENNLPALGARVRDGLELLRDDERLDASAIKNLPESKVVHTHSGGGALALYALMDVEIAGITAGQTLEWNGLNWVAVTPAGSGGTPVWGEDLTPQGPGTTFTLANTPVAGSVRLFRGGAYQSAANGDYSIAGDTITLADALSTGEVLVADYSH